MLFNIDQGGKFGTHLFSQFSNPSDQCLSRLGVSLLNSLVELLSQILDLAIGLNLSLIGSNDADEISCVRL